jgi:hypothetical protein
MNKFGDSLWSRNYGVNTLFPGFDFFDNTTFIVSGAMYYTNTSLPTISVGKMNMLGDTIWVKRFGHPYFTCPSYASIIRKDFKNNFIIGSNYACDYGYLVIDSLGNELWHHFHNMYYGCFDIKPDPLGGYVSCGGNGGVLDPYVVVRMDSAGNELWHHTYGVNYANAIQRMATQVVFTSDSNYLVSCYGDDWQLMKINRNSGDTMWTKNYADTANNVYFRLNTIAPAGTDTFICVSSGRYMLIDANGDSIWKKKLPFNPNNYVWQAKKTLDGGFAFSGDYFRFNPSRRIACFFKTDNMGEILSTGIFDLDVGIPISFYPNPASNEIYINTTKLAPDRDLLFSLYDLQGRTILQQHYDSTKPVDISTLPEGLYIATLKGKEKEVRGKVMVQR